MFTRGFLGVVPTKLIETIAALCQPQDWPAVFVACSGTFRTERGLLAKFPGLEVQSNDVSLLSTALGLAGQRQALDFRFKGELAWIEDFGFADPDQRIAAILLALNYSSYAKGKPNRFKTEHVAHLKANFTGYVADTRKMVSRVLGAMPIAGYFAGDFRDHIEAAIARKAGVIAYPPTFKGGYEKLFQFVHANVDWQEPSYRVFDPEADVAAVLELLNSSGVPFFLYLDQAVSGFKPAMRYEARGHRPIFGYTRASPASYRTPPSHGKPFSYRAVDLVNLSAASRLTILPVPEAQITFLREAFLKKSIAFGTGDFGVLVYIDGALAGAISYRKPLGSGMPLYVLTDMAVIREGRIAKLIARVATCRATIRPFETRLLARFNAVRTTAYSEHPEAMKYRGSWKVEKREEVNAKAGRYAINYLSDVRAESLDDCYAWWWKRDGERQVAEALGRAAAARSEDPQAA